MKLCDIIRTRRAELGLTLAQVAEACGVGTSVVAKWERGEVTNVRSASLAGLASALRVSPLALLGLEEPGENPAPLTDDERKLIDLVQALPPDKLPAALAVLQALANNSDK